MSEHSGEVDALRAEVEHWKAHAKEAGDGFTQVCRDYARVSARNVALVEGIDALADEYERRTDAIAITYQNPEQRARATAVGREIVRRLRSLTPPTPTRDTPTDDAQGGRADG